MAEDDTRDAVPKATGLSFANKTVLITGATSGIGRAAALAFAGLGANLAIVGRDAGRGADVAAACDAIGSPAIFLAADVTVADEIAGAVARTAERFGSLDIAFNNAGFQERRKAMADQPDAVFETVFAANVRAVFHAMKAELATMLPSDRGGVIINNASVSGVRNPNSGLALYSASKAAVISLSRSAALEYAPRGIRINTVSPGRVETPMMLASGVDVGAVAAGLPARRLGNPEEVAAAVVWLASDAASFVVGHNLCVDGGFLAT